MICSECSKENPAGTIFCMFCGKRLQKQKFCSKCGKECNSETLFCSGCGNKLSEDVQPQNFSFFCSGCGQKLEADESLCGEKVECPSCKQQITVPSHPQNIFSQKLDAMNMEAIQMKNVASGVIDHVTTEDSIKSLPQQRDLFLIGVLTVVTLGIYNIFLVGKWLKDLNYIHKQNHFAPYPIPIFMGVIYVVQLLLALSGIEKGFWGDLFSSLFFSIVACTILYFVYNSLMKSVSDSLMTAKLANGRGILFGLFLLEFFFDILLTITTSAQDSPSWAGLLGLFLGILSISIIVTQYVLIQKFFNDVIENLYRNAKR